MGHLLWRLQLLCLLHARWTNYMYLVSNVLLGMANTQLNSILSDDEHAF